MKFILLVLSVMFCTASLAQTTTTFYSDKDLQNESIASNANYTKTIIKMDDGVMILEVKDLKSNLIIKRECYKRKEAVGIWVLEGNEDKDYDFKLIYSESNCTDELSEIKNCFIDESAFNYIAPKLTSGEPNIFNFVAKNLNYPALARKNEIQGKVYVSFSISKIGEVEDIVVNKGVHLSLDKEAVRVIRKMKFSNPPTINGEAKKACVLLFPILFRLM